ncbi:MAG TPA: transcription termination factor NusA [Dehalococcoidales bacterium]|nr:transcription termination factor NusA [Dehalococcoidales bacterium]
MKSDFLLAITQLSAEKNLPKEVVLSAVEAALVSAYRKDNFTPNQSLSVRINPNSGRVEVWAEKTVVERPSDSRLEISVEEARKVKPDAQIGDIIMVEDTPHNAGRIAAQTAKQVILQRLHEAEHSAILEEYTDKEDDVVTGLVQRIEPGQAFIDLGRTEAILPALEQVRNERYRVGQRLKVCILQVMRTTKGPRVVVSRSHPDLLRRLLELEVPEVFNGTVEIKSIAREAGYRSKVAVSARQEGIDPVGCCVGLRGIRIQNIVNELNGEKIDVIMWSPEAATFITNALSPAQILSVYLNREEGTATVIVPDKQLSLAIGKEGQNARLAAKLTGWRIDIKSASAAEAEKAEAKLLTEEEEKEEETVVEEESLAEVPDILEPTPVSVEAPEKEVAEPTKPLPTAEEVFAQPPVFFGPKLTEEKTELRFAEDILVPRPTKPVDKAKGKKKKGAYRKESAEDGIRLKKHRQESEFLDEDEE